MSDGPIKLTVRVPSVALTLDKKKLRQVMRRAGAEVAAVTRAKIKSAAGGGVQYRGPGGSAAQYRGGYKQGGYKASSPGAPPVNVTGTLARSIKVRPFKSGEGVAVRETAFYAKFLSTGASGGGRISKGGKPIKGRSGIGKTRILLPRPSLTAALSEREGSIGARVQDAILNGIEFKRLKP